MAFDFMNKPKENNTPVQNEIKVQLRPQFIKMVTRMALEKNDFYNGHHCIEMCILSKYNELYGKEVVKKEVPSNVLDVTGFPSDDGVVDGFSNNFGGK